MTSIQRNRVNELIWPSNEDDNFPNLASISRKFDNNVQQI